MLEFKPINENSNITIGTILKLNNGELVVVGNVVGKFKQETGHWYTSYEDEKTITFNLTKIGKFGYYDPYQIDLIKPDFDFLKGVNTHINKAMLSEEYWLYPVEYCNFLVKLLESENENPNHCVENS